MNHASNLVIALATGTAIFVSGSVWHGLRRETSAREKSSMALAARVDRVAATCTQIAKQSDDAKRLLDRLGSELRRCLAAQPASREPEAEPSFGGEPDADTLDGSEHMNRDLNDVQPAAPSLPAGVDPAGILRRFRGSLDLSEILAHPELNPQERKPNYLQRIKILREMTRANAEVELLNGDLQLKLAEARDQLAGTQEFLEFAPGEKPIAEPGVITFGEKTEDGKTRIYYLHRERFPEIYDLRDRRRPIPQQALGRVMEILQ
jgi:hypothetical protein